MSPGQRSDSLHRTWLISSGEKTNNLCQFWSEAELWVAISCHPKFREVVVLVQLRCNNFWGVICVWIWPYRGLWVLVLSKKFCLTWLTISVSSVWVPTGESQQTKTLTFNPPFSWSLKHPNCCLSIDDMGSSNLEDFFSNAPYLLTFWAVSGVGLPSTFCSLLLPKSNPKK